MLNEMRASDGGLSHLLTIGVAVPEPVTELSGVKFDDKWHDFDVATLVTQRLGTPTVIENDGNAGAIAEAGCGAQGVLLVKVGTGIGAGIVVNGHLVRGTRGIAGELGHVVIDPNGRLCGCGNRGCLETLASITAVTQSLAPIRGPLSYSGLAKLLLDGDPVSCRAVRDAGVAIGTAMAPVVTVLDLDRVAISGPPDVPIKLVADGVRATLARLLHAELASAVEVVEAEAKHFTALEGALVLAHRQARLLTRGEAAGRPHLSKTR